MSDINNIISEIQLHCDKLKAMGVKPDTLHTRPMSPEQAKLFKAECKRLGIKYTVHPKKL